MSSPDLYLVKMEWSMSDLVELARRRRLSVRELDEGEVVHCALGELFRDKAPKPFLLAGDRARRRTPGRLEIHAYSPLPKAELLASADAFGDVDLHQGFYRESMKERRLPVEFPRQVGFTVRLCPIVRLRRDVDLTVDVPGKKEPVQIKRPVKGARKRGREVDAFEAACIASHIGGEGAVPSERRGEIYLDWFDRLMGRTEAVEVVNRRLLGLRWLHLSRRDHGAKRENHRLRRPEIVVRGVFNITDQEKFRELLARGIGRHKAFGFGMLMLQPAGEA